MTIEQNLKTYIDDHAINITGLADKSGVGRSLHRVIYEGAKLKADDAVKITRVLGIKVEDLCDE
jgi:plasmid maintenance system antidote protein VapI